MLKLSVLNQDTHTQEEYKKEKKRILSGESTDSISQRIWVPYQEPLNQSEEAIVVNFTSHILINCHLIVNRPALQ